jgi:hypothetical protein
MSKSGDYAERIKGEPADEAQLFLRQLADLGVTGNHLLF